MLTELVCELKFRHMFHVGIAVLGWQSTCAPVQLSVSHLAVLLGVFLMAMQSVPEFGLVHNCMITVLCVGWQGKKRLALEFS